MKKVNQVLLIDDDEVTNSLHQIILEDMDFCYEVNVALDGNEALEHVTKNEFSKEDPNLILLDVNMPGMDGFDFLDEYSKLEPEKKGNNYIFMLTTSQLDSDMKRAEYYEDVIGFMNKPLTEAKLAQIVRNHFR